MPKIALIEDNPDNRMLAVALLEDTYDIDEYENGHDALEGMAQKRPDVILLDISLPGIDGIEVLARIRAGELADIPTIALTAHAMAGDRDKFIGAGFDGYVSKPIVDEELLFDAIRKLLTKA